MSSLTPALIRERLILAIQQQHSADNGARRYPTRRPQFFRLCPDSFAELELQCKPYELDKVDLGVYRFGGVLLSVCPDAPDIVLTADGEERRLDELA